MVAVILYLWCLKEGMITSVTVLGTCFSQYCISVCDITFFLIFFDIHSVKIYWPTTIGILNIS